MASIPFQFSQQMSVEADSPVSSSSDDFAALIEAELESDSSDDASVEDNDDDVEEEDRIKRRKIMGDEVSTSYALSEDNSAIMESCPPHPGFFRDMCVRCGKRTDSAGSVALSYIHKDFRAVPDEISRIRNTNLRSLLRSRKLCLVLDLDHTLLNSTRLDEISSEEEEYLHKLTNSPKEISKCSLFRLDNIGMMTKLRPFVHKFLQEATKMFEMYIYTMGERPYALRMADLLDHEHLYFHSRVISKDDCTSKHQKDIDVVLGQESAVLILDDTEAVWKKHKDSLILMERYHFFSSSCRQYKSLCESKSDETELDGYLATILRVLKKIHAQFFDQENGDNYAAKYVRLVRRDVRKEILRGCTILFSRVIPRHGVAHEHPLWMLAEQLGATCSTELEESVTHVVSPDSGTHKSRWAEQEGKFLVHPRWLEASSYLWQRQPEEKFPACRTKKE